MAPRGGRGRDARRHGPVLGNRPVLDLGDGTWAVQAPLRRGSLAVREGERVTAGQLLARCGNSGDSTEPHLHVPLMDGPDPEAAHGIPFTWRGVGVRRAARRRPRLSRRRPRTCPPRRCPERTRRCRRSCRRRS
ncbi:M23 family metallopeptidase [Streptomyces wuyuanensis]|uniref:M23 family metallopeptidase n=1 Tax=Streptomyces wuyuanensis TaxID=1196353 RepID=UPI00379FE9A9